MYIQINITQYDKRGKICGLSLCCQLKFGSHLSFVQYTTIPFKFFSLVLLFSIPTTAKNILAKASFLVSFADKWKLFWFFGYQLSYLLCWLFKNHMQTFSNAIISTLSIFRQLKNYRMDRTYLRGCSFRPFWRENMTLGFSRTTRSRRWLVT